MKKLKKSLSFILTFVMLFTTLCFFVPETEIEVNAATTTYKYQIVFNVSDTGNNDKAAVYVNFKANNGTGGTQTKTIASYGSKSGWLKDGSATLGPYESDAGYFPYSVRHTSTMPWSANASYSVSLQVYNNNTGAYETIMSSSSRKVEGGWGGAKDYDYTDEASATTYPYVNSSNLSGGTKYIPDNASYTTVQPTITAVDQYGVEWVNAPTTTVSGGSASIASGTTKSPIITFNNANADYTTTATSTWSTGNSSNSSVSKTATYTVYVQRKFYLQSELFSVGTWNSSGMNGSSASVTYINDNSLSVTATGDGTTDGNTGFSYIFRVQPETIYILTADVDYQPLNETDTFDVYFQPVDAEKKSLAGSQAISGCGVEGTYYISSPGNRSTVKKVALVFKTPANTSYGRIRFDANKSGNTLTASNISVKPYGSRELTGSTVILQGDKNFSAYTLPVLTSNGFTFDGWGLTTGGYEHVYDKTGKWVFEEMRVDSYFKLNESYSAELAPLWIENHYNIAFNANGGSGTMASITDVPYTNYVTLTANEFTKTGYTFNGWNTKADGTGIAVADKGKVAELAADNGATATLYAQWTPISYNIAFDGNGATAGTMNPVVADYDSDKTLPANTFTKTGHIFAGWNTSRDGSGATVADGGSVKNLASASGATVYLYAQWEKANYKVTYNSNGGSTVADQTYEYGATINAPSDPVREGYTFIRWDNLPETMPSSDITAVAVWEPIIYTLTYDSNGGTSVGSQTYKFNDAITPPDDPTRTGYAFGGWEGLPTNMPANNLTVEAIWVKNEYTISYDTAGGSAVDSQTAKYDESINLAAAPTRTGYTFGGWVLGDTTYEAGQLVNNLVTEGSVTLKAKWTANTYYVEFNADGADGTMAKQEFKYDKAGTLSALGFTKTGYHFVGWATTANGEKVYDDAAEVINLASTNNATVALYAIWEIDTFRVTITYVTADGTETTTTLPDVEYGTAFSAIAPKNYAEVYFTDADADNHYNFQGWTADGTAISTAYEITADVAVTASYKANAHEIYKDLINSTTPKCGVEGKNVYACDCGYTYEETVPALEHNWVDVEGTNTATCTSEGTVDQICSYCSATRRYTAAALGHIEKAAAEENRIPASCTENGSYDMVVRCERCNEIVSKESFVIYAVGHNYGEITAETAPGCTTTGVAAHKQCTVCEKFFAADADEFSTDAKESADDFIINKNGHTAVEHKAVAPKCEEDGNIKYYTCEDCDLYFADSECTVVISAEAIVDPATGHDYGDLIEEVPATCEEDGTKAHYKCSACDKIFDENKNELTSLVIGKKGHTYGEFIPETPATCVDEGIKGHYNCSACGKNFNKDKVELDTIVIDINENNHSLVDVIAQIPSCEAIGWEAYEYCNREGCEYTTYEPIGATGHDYKAEITTPVTCITNGLKTFTCSHDNSHVYTEEITATGHVFTEATKVIEPGCVEDGMDSYKTCTVCEKYFKADADIFTAEAYENTEEFILGHTGHDYDVTVTPPTCEEQGFITHTCKKGDHTYVDTYVDELGHTEGAVVIENKVAPGCLVDGSHDEVVYCTVCSKELSREEKTDAATGHTNAVRQENVVGATCTTRGSYDNVTYCSVCNVVLKTETVTGVTLPHNYTEKIIDGDHLKSAATCTLYAVYYYDCADCDANAKKENADTFEYVEGGYAEGNHVGTTTTADENIVNGTCIAEKTWNEVTRCDDCKEIITSVAKTGEKDPHNHVGGTRTENEDVVPGTCMAEETWNEVVYCNSCNVELSSTAKTGEKDPQNHATTERVRKDVKTANCHETGFTGNLYCAECDEIVVTGEVTAINPENHDGETEVRRENIVAGTCIAPEKWTNVTYCLGCNEPNGETTDGTGNIDPDNHVGTRTDVHTTISAATCIAKEVYCIVTSCNSCGHEITRTENTEGELNPQNHTGAPTVIKNASETTCHTEGYTGDKHYDCCDALYEKGAAIPVIEHTPANAVVKNTVNATCTVDGHYDSVVYCAVEECKAELSRETIAIPAPGHTAGEEKTENNVAPTCTADGHYDTVVYCSVCDAQLSRVTTTVPATGHTNAAAVVENNVAPTCTADGHYDTVVYCSVCTAQLSRVTTTVPATGHTDAEAVIENRTAATCTADGYYESVIYCAVCDAEIARTPATIPATGHTADEAVTENNVKPTCTADGRYDTVVYCGICDAEISRITTVVPATGHTAGETVYENVKPATATANGSRDEVVYCTACGAELSRETVVLRPERTITFIMHDRTVVEKAFTGDTVKIPTVNSYTTDDGFIHQLKSWDKEITVVTGDATYEAIYTEPCDYTELDKLQETLDEILLGGLVEDEVLAEYQARIDEVQARLDELNETRNTLDASEQAQIDVVVTKLEAIIDYIYPDVDSTLEIIGNSTFYTGSVLNLQAVRMPVGTVLSDVQWTSSDDSIVFCSNGRIFAVGVGTVTITAKRGILVATKTVEIISGGNTRAVNFIAMDKAHFIVEDYFTIFNSAGIYWSNDSDLRFRVYTYQNFPYETYIVYIGGVEATPDEDGYYTVPAGSGSVRVTMSGAVYGDDSDGSSSTGKWNFWEWLINLFRKIAALFGIG